MHKQLQLQSYKTGRRRFMSSVLSTLSLKLEYGRLVIPLWQMIRDYSLQIVLDYNFFLIYGESLN